MAMSRNWIAKIPEGRTLAFYFTKAEYAKENIEKKRVKISKFEKCNDIFELSSFSMKKPEVRCRHGKWLKETNKKIGLICFSECWRHPLMWGHYADNGSGVCMAFSVPTGNLSQVKYMSEREKKGGELHISRSDFEREL